MRRVSGVVPVDWLVGRRQRKLKIIHARRVDFRGDDTVFVEVASPKALFHLARKFKVRFVIEDATRYYCVLHRRVVLYAQKRPEETPFFSAYEVVGEGSREE